MSTVLVKIGLGLLILQNAILAALLAGVVTEYAFYIDLAGFLLLGVGLIMKSGEDKNLLIAGICMLGWLAARVTWQFILASGIFTDSSSDWEAALNTLVDTLLDMVLALLISSVLLVIGAFFYFKSKSGGGTIFLVYGVFNVVATYLFTSPLLGATLAEAEAAVGGMFVGILLKLIVVPILGVVTFLVMFLKFDKEEE
jgi:hypothetical protein